MVLDVACGEGYGSHLLATSARAVEGVDIDSGTVSHATERYRAPNLKFQCADVLALPFNDAHFDRVVCFETLEHLHDHEGLVNELKRVLKPEGLLILSSPNKASSSDEDAHDNPFHCKELYRDELEALLERHFQNYRLFGQKLVFASTIGVLDDVPADGMDSDQWLIKNNSAIESRHGCAYTPQYYLAVATPAGSIKQIGSTISLFSDIEESIYAHYHEEIRHHMFVGELLAEKDAEIERLKSQQTQPWWKRWWAKR